MKNLIYSKKGILLTIGLTFLVLVVLMLAVLIFHNAQKSEEIVAKLIVLDRVYDLDTSIDQSLGDIIYIKGGIFINITDDGVSFKERLPNNNAKKFNNSIIEFKEFIESNFSNINITIDNTIRELPLVVMPYDITYRHLGFGDDEIEVTPAQINFDGYSVYTVINKNVSSCNWNVQDGSFYLSVKVIGQNGDSCSDSRNIDPSGDNDVIINGGEFNVEVNNKVLSVTVDKSKDIYGDVETTIIKNSERMYVEAASINVDISFNELGVYKGSAVRID